MVWTPHSGHRLCGIAPQRGVKKCMACILHDLRMRSALNDDEWGRPQVFQLSVFLCSAVRPLSRDALGRGSKTGVQPHPARHHLRYDLRSRWT